MIFFIDTAFDITKLAIKKENFFYEEIIDANTNISQVLIDRTKIILDKSKSKKKDIKLIIFNQGPGNFTSLRVALAYIKAIAFYINIPIITLNSFQILFAFLGVCNGVHARKSKFIMSAPTEAFNVSNIYFGLIFVFSSYY